MNNAIEGSFCLQRQNNTLNFDFAIPSDGITGVLGPSGSGKTSLLRCIAGLTRPQKGRLSINTICWQNSDADIFVPAHKRQIGFVFQQPNLFPHLSVRGNLLYGYRRVSKDRRYITLEQVTNWMSLESLLDREIHGLSGGELQRIAIARALLSSPKLLLLDEPVTALDSKHKNEVLACIYRLHKEIAIPILYETHSLDEISYLADYLLMIKNGSILACGPAQDLLTNPELPLVFSKNACSVIKAKLIAHDAAFQLSYLKFSGGEIIIPLQDVQAHQQLRVLVFAKDVSLSLKEPEQSSTLNVFPARIVSIINQCIVTLDLNGTTLISHITHKAKTLLNLEPGMKVYVQVKTVNLQTCFDLSWEGR